MVAGVDTRAVPCANDFAISVDVTVENLIASLPLKPMSFSPLISALAGAGDHHRQEKGGTILKRRAPARAKIGDCLLALGTLLPAKS